MSTYNRKRNMRNLESFNQVAQMNMMNTNLNNLNSSPPSMDPNNMAMSVDMMSKMVGSSQDNKETFIDCPEGEVDDGNGNCVETFIDCPDGEVDDGMGNCVENFIECPDGQVDDGMGNCVENFVECPEGEEDDGNGNCVEKFEDGCEADGTCYEGCPEGDENCNEGFEDGCEADGTCNQGTECTGDDCDDFTNTECTGDDCDDFDNTECTGDSCDDFTNTCADEDKDENGNCPEPFTDTNKDMELWTCYPSNLEKSRETFESTDKYTAGGDVTYGSLGKAVASAASVNDGEMNKLYMYLAIGVIILMIIYLLTCRK